MNQTTYCLQFYSCRYPPIDWHRINGVFNRTMTFRRDSDVVVRSFIFITQYDIKSLKKPNFVGLCPCLTLSSKYVMFTDMVT